MTLFDRSVNSGRVNAIGGDPQTHRWLADIGLLDAAFTVKSRKKNAVLIEIGEPKFYAVVGATAAKQIEVVER